MYKAFLTIFLKRKDGDPTIKTQGIIAEEFMLIFLMPNVFKKLIFGVVVVLFGCAIIIWNHSSYKKPEAYVNLLTVPPSILENPTTLNPHNNIPVFNTHTSLPPFFNQTSIVFGNQKVSLLKDQAFPSKMSIVTMTSTDCENLQGNFSAVIEGNSLDTYKKYLNFKEISDHKKAIGLPIASH
jgi:hypothetical protein